MTDKHEERHRKVSERAYAIWEEEGRPGGRHDQHWHDAARDVDASETVETPAPKAKAAPRKYVRKDKAAAAAPAPTESTKPAPAANAKAPAVSETPTAAVKPPVKATRAPRTIKPKKP